MLGIKAKAIYNKKDKLDGSILLIEKGEIVDIVRDTNTFSFPIIDYANCVITPGFMDAHAHWGMTSLEATYTDLSSQTSLKGALSLIDNKVRTAPKEEILVFKNLRYSAFEEKRYPLKEELDSVAPDHMIVVKDQTAHGCVLNSNGFDFFEKLGLTCTSNEFTTGLLTGSKSYDAMNLLDAYLVNNMDFEKAWLNTCNNAIKKGVTAAVVLEGALGNLEKADLKDIEFYKNLCKKSPIDLTLFYQTMDVEAIVASGLDRIGGCILADGAFSPHTAALYEPYFDDPSTKGILYISDEDMFDFVKKARENGLQIAMHACGDAAIGQILEVYEKVFKDIPSRDHRCRIEHFEIPWKWQIEKALELNVLPSMQPSFDYFWDMDVYEKLLGEERARRKKPFKSLLDLGMHIPVGSDSPVTPIDPLLGIQSLVTNSNVNERVSIREAINLFTIESAYGVFKETEFGSFDKGMSANFVVLEEDPEMVDPQNIKDIAILETVIRGNSTTNYKNLHE